MSFKQQAIKSKLQLSYKDVWHENDRKLKFKPPHAEYVCKSTNSWTPDFHVSDFFSRSLSDCFVHVTAARAEYHCV